MRLPREPDWLAIDLPTNFDGVSCSVQSEWGPIEASSGWLSNGGSARNHPFRALPFSVELALPEPGAVKSVVLVGVFSLFAGNDFEAPGTFGASVALRVGKEDATRHDLINGRHYSVAQSLAPVVVRPGDGTSIDTVGTAQMDGQALRLDALRIEWLEPVQADAIRFRDLGSPASFLLLGAFVEVSEPHGCPFHSKSGGVGLGEIGAIVRMGDRRRMALAMDQLKLSILSTNDLDEARGEALTFLAAVTVASLEMGAPRAMHRAQLDAARELEKLQTAVEVSDFALSRIPLIAPFMLSEPQTPSEKLVELALTYVDRHYARNLTDATLATELALSTSHFRFLFRQATGQPFHRYLVNLRLEKARQLLIENPGLSIGDVANAVGFRSLPHFSRAFSQRFQNNPTSLRDGVRIDP